MTKETISTYIKNYCGSDLAGDLHTYLLKIAAVKDKRYSLDQERRQIEESYATVKNNWQAKLRRLQESCPHPEVHFHGDPSGGHDSYHQCQYCGAIL